MEQQQTQTQNQLQSQYETSALWGVGLDNFHYPTDEISSSVLKIVWDMRKQFKVGSEIRHMTLPPVVCQPRSLLLKLADNFCHANILFDIGKLENNSNNSDEEQQKSGRLLTVLKFIISGYSMGPPPEAVRHVFNPVIGEHCSFSWTHDDSSITNFLAEQISHHPPISTFTASNDKHRFLVEATVRPQYVQFFGNYCTSNIDGLLLLHLLDFNETYQATFPSYAVNGLLLGKTRIGYTGRMKLECAQTGYSASLELHTKKKSREHWIKGYVSNSQGVQLFKITGTWNGDVSIEDLKTGSSSLFFSPTKSPALRPIAKQPHELDCFSSERVWQVVEENIKSKNDEQALVGKLKIEQSQREEEAKRKTAGLPHTPQFFHLDTSVQQNFYRSNNLMAPVQPLATKEAKPATVGTPSINIAIASSSPSVRR